ncbi:MAG: hypothetical protein ACPGJV_07050 [Bacteriovoracaceae bacterium]
MSLYFVFNAQASPTFSKLEFSKLIENKQHRSGFVTDDKHIFDIYGLKQRKILIVATSRKTETITDQLIVKLTEEESIADIVPFSCSFKSRSRSNTLFGIFNKKQAKQSDSFPAKNAYFVKANGGIAKVRKIREVHYNWTPASDEEFPTFFPK